MALRAKGSSKLASVSCTVIISKYYRKLSFGFVSWSHLDLLRPISSNLLGLYIGNPLFFFIIIFVECPSLIVLILKVLSAFSDSLALNFYDGMIAFDGVPIIASFDLTDFSCSSDS